MERVNTRKLMIKILATTDFSPNSKAGLRFAIQLAAQTKGEICFFHMYYIPSPVSWTAAKTATYEKTEIEKLQNTFDKFINTVYKLVGVTQKHTNCLVSNPAFREAAIMIYAEENKFDFICIGTRGAGKVGKFLGSNTSNLINQSLVPVIAVPPNYRTQKIEKIIYASDLVNLQKELKRVVQFAKPLKAKLELLHFSFPAEPVADGKVLKAAVAAFSKYDVKLNIKNIDYVKTLIDNIEAAVKINRPSMLIMFTEQHRTLFQKIFLPGKSADYSFDSKIPLLVFNKS